MQTNKIKRQAMLDGMLAQRELEWAGRHANPNTTFTKVMGGVFGIISLLMVYAVTTDPTGWPVLFLAAFFGLGALIAPAAVRQELKEAEEAKAIIEKWNRKIDEIVK